MWRSRMCPEKTFSKLHRAILDVSLGFFGMPVLRKLKGSFCVLSADTATKISKNVWVLFPESVSAANFFVDEVDEGSHPDNKFIQGDNSAFDWLITEGELKNDEGLIDGMTGFMTRCSLLRRRYQLASVQG